MDEQKTKRCRGCGLELPATEEYFGRVRDWLRGDCRTCRSKYCREWRLSNHERELERAANYRENHRTQSRESVRRWTRANPERHRTHVKLYKARKRNAVGRFNSDQIASILRQQKSRCWYCQKSLEDGYHIEHRVPLSRGGSNNPSNLVLACPKCNLSKGDKLPSEWSGRLL